MEEAGDRVAIAKAATMEYLGLTEDEVSYITLDLLDAPVGDPSAIEEVDMVGDSPELPAGALAMAAVVPNRIWYMSEFTPGGFNPSRGNVWYFYANCDRRYRYYIFDTQIARREQAGYCGTGGGRYTVRWKVWWRE